MLLTLVRLCRPRRPAPSRSPARTTRSRPPPRSAIPPPIRPSPSPRPELGDTPVDHPGASRAVEFEPPRTIEVVRPERTIVRDVDEVLPLVLSGTALLIAVAGAAFLLVGGVRRGRIGRSH